MKLRQVALTSLNQTLVFFQGVMAAESYKASNWVLVGLSVLGLVIFTLIQITDIKKALCTPVPAPEEPKE